MNLAFFNNAFRNLGTPVIICVDDSALTVVYENIRAKELFNPQIDLVQGQFIDVRPPLSSLLRFATPSDYDMFCALLRAQGSLQNYVTSVRNFSDQIIPASMTVNPIALAGTGYLIFYLYTQAEQRIDTGLSSVFVDAFHLACHAPDTEEAINSILAHAGNRTQISRVYVFEEISPTATANTYEWCSADTDPAIHLLQNLPKDEYPYDEIIARGLFVVSDIAEIDQASRAILEVQGIKSLAIIPIFAQGRALGYVGFDDCARHRTWSSAEIQALRELTDILASLMVRRDIERSLSRSLEVLQTVTDSSDNLLYVNDVNTYKLVFVNRALAEQMGAPSETLIGQPCWQALGRSTDGPCSNCPQARVQAGESYVWEHHNPLSDKWYLTRDSVVKWIDEREAHISTATEITHQKEYEAQLKHIASQDMMTGLYNREWGYRIMQQMAQNGAQQDSSLVFIDLDGLKRVNDTFGHEAGDRMILRTVDVLRQSVRKSDTICRWGGDEFVMLLRCDVAQAERIMENIEGELQKINDSRDLPFDLGLSFGITALDATDQAGIDAQISRADRLMYERKMAKKPEGFRGC